MNTNIGKWALAVCLTAACGAPARKTEPAPVSAASRVCPGADRVIVARWMEQTDEGEKLAPGWRAFVTNRSIDQDDGPNYQALDRAPAGVALPSQIWIDAGGTPCAARVTRAFRMITRVGPVSEQIGVELEGCAKPADAPEETFGLVGAEDFSGCAWTLTSDVAIRGGDVADDDRWAPSADSTPIPAEIASAIDQRACTGGCVPLWYVRGADAFAYDVIQTWMKSTTGPSCELEHDDGSTVLVRGTGGLTRLADADVGNQELVGVFHDAGGARLAVLDDVGEYSVVALGATPKLAVHRVWFDKNEEDENHRSLAPYCGP
jgi:hypothetical protein